MDTTIIGNEIYVDLKTNFIKSSGGLIKRRFCSGTAEFKRLIGVKPNLARITWQAYDANLSFFMVNFSSVLLRKYRKNNPKFSVLDLKSHYRGCRYVSETIKLLPRKPDGILLSEIFQQIARLGMVHPAFEPVSTA